MNITMRVVSTSCQHGKAVRQPVQLVTWELQAEASVHRPSLVGCAAVVSSLPLHLHLRCVTRGSVPCGVTRAGMKGVATAMCGTTDVNLELREGHNPCTLAAQPSMPRG